MMKKKVSILVPAYNEEASLPAFYQAISEVISGLPDYEWELFFVDDGSIDGTRAVIDNLYVHDSQVSFISLSRNFGKESAMLAGLDHVTGDCVVIMDADLQHPPQLLASMLKYWEEGYEDVYGRRRSRGDESWLRQKMTLLFYSILDRSTRFNVLQNVGDFRLLDRKCINALRQFRETERYSKGLFSWIGFKKKEILFDQEPRRYGSSHWNYFQLFGLAVEGITSFTTAPLRLATLLGFITGLGAIIYLVWTLVKVLIWGDPVAGYPTLICVMLFLGSVQLICLGIIGEYLGRVFTESKQRPVYLIEEYKQRK